MARPQADHYIGQNVTEVTSDPEAEQSWGIRFLGGAAIYNVDPERVAEQPAVAGMTLVNVIIGELETRLLFSPNGEMTESTVTVTLTPDKYVISDPHYEGGIVYPQLPVENDLPPDPSDERTNEGPTTEGTLVDDSETPVDDAENDSKTTDGE